MLFGFLEVNFLSSLYILDISPLSDVGLVKILFPIYRFLFVLLSSGNVRLVRLVWKVSYHQMLITVVVHNNFPVNSINNLYDFFWLFPKWLALGPVGNDGFVLLYLCLAFC